MSSERDTVPQVDTGGRVHASSAQTPSPVGHHDTVQSLQGPLSAGDSTVGTSHVRSWITLEHESWIWRSQRVSSQSCTAAVRPLRL